MTGAPDTCPLCGSATVPMPTRPVVRFAEAGLAVDTFGSSRKRVGHVRVVRCAKCGLGWQSPMPTAEALKETYRSMEDERRLLDVGGRERPARRYLRLLSRYAGDTRGRLLDVGCSTGVFLHESLRNGWDAIGIEPSAWLAAHARARLGARVRETTLEDEAFDDQSFAAVTMWDVLEHMTDPIGALRKVVGLLCPGGTLGINVPNIDSLPARFLGARWPLILPEHTFYFTPRSLGRLFEQSGLSWLGAHAHPVFFSAGYVAERLKQHDVSCAGFVGRILRALRMDAVNMPVLMGEMTVFARRSA